MATNSELEQLEATLGGRQPDSGWGYVFAGIVIAVAALLLSLSAGSEVVAVLLLPVASVLCAIGAIAVGVTVGIRRADYRRAVNLVEHWGSHERSGSHSS